MKSYRRIALLAGAALVFGAGLASAQVMPPPPPPDMYGPGSLHGRLSDRALRDFDLNKDGKITKAEVEKVLARRFSEAAGGKATLSESQFATAHEKMLHEHTDMMFRRADWNGDGVLSLGEFRAPLRARFTRVDRDGSGTVSCKPADRRHGSSVGKWRGHGPGKLRHHRGYRPHFHRGFKELCQDADLNKDGKVTRSELDKVVAKKFAAAVKGGKGMTPEEFYRVELVRFHDMEARRFKRLDKNHDGKLNEAEFAAPGRHLFARLDKNSDGVLSKDELSHPRHRHPGAHHQGPR